VFYKHRASSTSFTIYTNHSEDFLRVATRKVARIYEGFSDLFELPLDSVPRSSILLEGDDSGVIDHRHEPDVLGYYVSFLNLIAIDEAPCGSGDELLDQVLLHEVAHHFIATEWSRAGSECWLNEGLAGALEMGLFDDEGFEHPLFNPVLYLIARHAAYTAESEASLESVLSKSWSEFHRKSDKERNYALAWSAVYFLLEQHLPKELSLGKRIEMLYTMDRKRIASLQGPWTAFLRGFDMEGRLLDWAHDEDPRRRRTALRATRLLGTARLSEPQRILRGLVGLFDAKSPALRSAAREAFVARLELTARSTILEDAQVLSGIVLVRESLVDPREPASSRASLARALAACPRTRELWLRSLVELLPEEDGEVRASAAFSLANLTDKPTFVNPAFWYGAALEDREQEVGEWRLWLDQRELWALR